MGRSSILGAALLLAAGCVDVPYDEAGGGSGSPYGPTSQEKSVIESRYRSHLYETEKGFGVEADSEASRAQSLAAAVRRYEDQAKVTLWRVVVGLPPNETTAGYIRRVVFPRVVLYNRDTGRYESASFEFNYVHDAELSPLPKGVIQADGRTLLVGRKAGQEWFLGRYSLEAGALLVLHVCPCCGVSIPESVFLTLSRPDLRPEEMGKFKEAMVSEHVRQMEGYEDLRGLPEEFWRFPHRHSCAAAGEKEFGEEATVPVRLDQVKSRELLAKVTPPSEPAGSAEPPKEGEGGGEKPKDAGEGAKSK